MGINEMLETGWRILDDGETIPSDTQLLHDDCETWSPLSKDAIGGVTLGEKYNCRFHVPMRTKEPRKVVLVPNSV